MFSRNASSSRAIPLSKMLQQVRENPAMPVHYGKNQPGMQAREELADVGKKLAIQKILNIRNTVADMVEDLYNSTGLHKQVCNRYLEPFQEMHTIITATEWDNFFKLRRHEDAQPEIKVLADAMWNAMKVSVPRLLEKGEWHLPYVNYHDIISVEEARKLSAARCARVSYRAHDQAIPDPAKDIALHDKLLESGHMSPFEHQATPASDNKFYANFKGWRQYRGELSF